MTFKPAPIKPPIAFAVFDSLDIRLGSILSVHDVPRSRKLVKLIVSFGDHTRTILAGLKGERENPSQLAGCQSLFVINLEPRAMAGEVSEGMLLDIGHADGLLPALAIPERGLPDGARAG